MLEIATHAWEGEAEEDVREEVVGDGEEEATPSEGPREMLGHDGRPRSFHSAWTRRAVDSIGPAG
jgi:hypothetical protein